MRNTSTSSNTLQCIAIIVPEGNGDGNDDYRIGTERVKDDVIEKGDYHRSVCRSVRLPYEYAIPDSSNSDITNKNDKIITSSSSICSDPWKFNAMNRNSTNNNCHSKVFGLCSYTSTIITDATYVIACTSNNEIVIWNISDCINTPNNIDFNTITTTKEQQLQQEQNVRLGHQPLWSSMINVDENYDEDDYDDGINVQVNISNINNADSIATTTTATEMIQESTSSVVMDNKNIKHCRRPILRLRFGYEDDIDDLKQPHCYYQQQELYHCEMIQLSPAATTQTIKTSTQLQELQQQKEQHYLLCCGDIGVVMLNWDQDILPILLNAVSASKNTKCDLKQPQLIPFRHYRPYPIIVPNSNSGKNQNSRWSGNIINNTNNKRQRTTTTSTSNYTYHYSEINYTIAVVVHDDIDRQEHQYIFGAANDTFGCYKWDLQTCQIITTYTTTSTIVPSISTSSALLNSNVNTIYTIAYHSTNNTLLIGGEDGCISIWDVHTDQCIDSINIMNQYTTTCKSNKRIVEGKTSTVVGKDYHRRGSNLININNNNGFDGTANTASKVYILSCSVYKDDYWMIGGGYHTPTVLNNISNTGTSSSQSSNAHGFIAIVHGPSRTVLSWMNTECIIQQLKFIPILPQQQKISDTILEQYEQQHTLIALTNTNYVYHWTNPLQLLSANESQQDYQQAQYQKIWCHSPSSYASSTITAITKNNAIGSSTSAVSQQFIAVAGVGSIIDIYINGAQHQLQHHSQIST